MYACFSYLRSEGARLLHSIWRLYYLTIILGAIAELFSCNALLAWLRPFLFHANNLHLKRGCCLFAVVPQGLLHRLRKDIGDAGGDMSKFDKLRDVRSLEYDVVQLSNKNKVRCCFVALLYYFL